MPKIHKNIINVQSENPPVVELDSAAHAAYIRFCGDKIQRTEVINVVGSLITMDVSAEGKVVGVELIGVADFSIRALINKAGIRGVSEKMVQNTRYVPANDQVLAPA